MTRKLRLGAFMRPISIHTAAWRYPGANPAANFDLEAIVGYARTLERGIFDPGQIRRIVARPERGQEDLDLQLWTLISTELWCRQFLDGGITGKPDVALAGAR